MFYGLYYLVLLGERLGKDGKDMEQTLDPPPVPKIKKGHVQFIEPISDAEKFKRAKNITDILK